jgi:hypothetical protein
MRMHLPQWRECSVEAETRRGTPHQALALDPCVVPRRRWGLPGWSGMPWASALDTTTIPRSPGLARSGLNADDLAPVGRVLVGVRDPHQERVVEEAPDELHANREPV